MTNGRRSSWGLTSDSRAAAEMAPRRILVLGASGYLGKELVTQSLRAGLSVAATYANNPRSTSGATWHQIDLTDADRTMELVTTIRPDVIINAAYRQSSWADTADTAVNAAHAAAATRARLVFVSSDVVFDGHHSPYAEGAAPSPITPYGSAKLAAETAIATLTPTAVIARTSLIVGSDGVSPQERRVRDLAQRRATGVLFTDDIRCPVHVSDLAAALLELAATERSGIHHLAGSDAISRYEMGVLIAQRDGLDASLLQPGTRAGSDSPGPLDVRLDSSATQAQLRTRLRGAREFLVKPG